MPFYEYTLSEGPGCDYCRDRFTVLQKLNDPRLTECPQCHSTVRRLISSPNVVGSDAEKLKPSNVEKAGFTQYRKIGKGVYEKTAGKGPGIISAD